MCALSRVLFFSFFSTPFAFFFSVNFSHNCSLSLPHTNSPFSFYSFVCSAMYMYKKKKPFLIIFISLFCFTSCSCVQMRVTRVFSISSTLNLLFLFTSLDSFVLLLKQQSISVGPFFRAFLKIVSMFLPEAVSRIHPSYALVPLCSASSCPSMDSLFLQRYAPGSSGVASLGRPAAKTTLHFLMYEGI